MQNDVTLMDLFGHLLAEQRTDEFKQQEAEREKTRLAGNRERNRKAAKKYKERHPDHVKMRNRLDRFRPALFRRQDGICHWCDKSMQEYHVDHIIPLSQGGTNALANLCVAHPRCNMKRKRT